ncbi:hypothetical protein FA95DRAFT_303328 [Auriscalpium vulgare]|uniref:Uncharacterized protein n=1 Tax=Auriscalpium vulgare TaxID=40419 RepID=A0ACB8RJ68_9AGAM|nr:hypothetical protein FA95DRAFT_303328 [Auriscalpium vulgare]
MATVLDPARIHAPHLIISNDKGLAERGALRSACATGRTPRLRCARCTKVTYANRILFAGLRTDRISEPGSGCVPSVSASLRSLTKMSCHRVTYDTVILPQNLPRQLRPLLSMGKAVDNQSMHEMIPAPPVVILSLMCATLSPALGHGCRVSWTIAQYNGITHLPRGSVATTVRVDSRV